MQMFLPHEDIDTMNHEFFSCIIKECIISKTWHSILAHVIHISYCIVKYSFPDFILELTNGGSTRSSNHHQILYSLPYCIVKDVCIQSNGGLQYLTISTGLVHFMPTCTDTFYILPFFESCSCSWACRSYLS